MLRFIAAHIREQGAVIVEVDRTPARCAKVRAGKGATRTLEERLIDAIGQGRESWVRARIRDGASINLLHDLGGIGLGTTALSRAISKRNIRIVRMLLEAGANPDQIGHISTPLLQAVEMRSISCCELLLAYGADPELRSTHGQAPITAASGNDARSQAILALLSSARASRAFRLAARPEPSTGL